MNCTSLLLGCCAIALYGCTSAPIYTVNDAPVVVTGAKQVSLAKVRDAIVHAGTRRGGSWLLVKTA
jgi:hypothetical protein